jgi:hypothetical protein
MNKETTTTKYIVGTSLINDAGFITCVGYNDDEEPVLELFDTLQDAESDLEDDEVTGYSFEGWFVRSVVQDLNGDWIDNNSVNWSMVGREQT